MCGSVCAHVYVCLPFPPPPAGAIENSPEEDNPISSHEGISVAADI